MIFQCHNGSDVHRRWEGIVGALRHIAVIVWMQQLFTCQFIAAVRQHLIAIHIRLRTAARLPNGKRKMPIQLAL